MKSNDSITADEKKLLDYAYEKANDIIDYCRRNGIILPVSINVFPDFKVEGSAAFDYRRVNFSQYYPSGRTRRIVSLSFNHCTGSADYDESLYEDTDDE